MRRGGAIAVALMLSACAGPARTGTDPGAAPTAHASAQRSEGRASPTRAPTRAPGPRPTPSRNPLADAVEDIDPAGLDPRSGRGSLGPDALGADLSWPQCPRGMGIPERRSKGLPMPDDAARFVVVGLTNGPGFTTNPCLADQVAWARDRRMLAAAYAVVSWPQEAELRRFGGQGPYDGATRLGALANAGYQQALVNVGTMRAAGLPSPIIWIDVEPVPGFDWSRDTEANTVVVAGAARGYRDAGYAIGVYSTPSMWRSIVGTLSLGVAHEWRPAGGTSRAEALSRCGPDWSIQGGDGVLAQWVEDGRDLDTPCPGAVDRAGALFHQY